MKLTNNVMFREEFFGGILYLKDRNIFMEINSDSLEILRLIKKNYDKNLIIEKSGISEKDLNEFIKVLENLNAIK